MPSFDRVELEQITRQVILILADEMIGVNAAIGDQNTLWSSRDAAFWNALSKSDPGVTVEEVELANFYPGHVPSLINAPIERFPNISVMTYQATALQSTDDWSEQYTIQCAIEVMCHAISTAAAPEHDPDVLAAEAVNSRIHRTVAAVHATLSSDEARSLANLVPRVGNTPDIIVTNVFAGHQEKGRGPRWFWQGARVEYRVQAWYAYGGADQT